MLMALQDRVQPGMKVLDLGTGSGILAIPAAMLGAQVLALDVSEVAEQVARQNVAANGLDGLVRVEEGTIAAVAGQRFDLILANIIASVLIDLSRQLAAALRPGAELLASGIIDSRRDDVRQAFLDAGLAHQDEQLDGDWWMIAARRP
jgi:ribosomal protein L11 methyltransferase